MPESNQALFDPLAWNFYPRMHEVYDRLRAADPVHWYEYRREWVLTRHAEVQAVLRDPAMLPMQLHAGIHNLEAASGLSFPALHQLLSASILLQSPPGHLVARKMLGRVLNARPAADFAPLMEQKARELLATARANGGFDAARDFAEPLPYSVIAHLLGIPEEDLPFVIENSLDVAPMLFERLRQAGEYRSLNARVAVALDYMEGLLRERRRSPRDDGLSRILEFAAADPLLKNRSLAASIYFLFIAGGESTVALLSSSVLSLLNFPAQAERWRRQEVSAESAVEELLRFESPAHQTIRQATAPGVLGRKTIEPGQAVVLVLGAANRDPAVFAEPHQLDLGRPRSPHVAFGDGVHACLGATLARLEARIALPLFLELPAPRRATETLEWCPYENIRKFKSLPLTLT